MPPKWMTQMQKRPNPVPPDDPNYNPNWQKGIDPSNDPDEPINNSVALTDPDLTPSAGRATAARVAARGNLAAVQNKADYYKSAGKPFNSEAGRKPAPLRPATSSATDDDIQRASDMITGRQPDEDVETRESYGPGVRPRPINMQNYLTKLRNRKK